ncbi:hypothetical protein G7Y79_00014g037410 [Physcia stellaris]|nr:hypothetical protein G7Y79_00014g037410 [Physcia stellaris]
MSSKPAYPPGGTWFDTLKKSFTGVTLDATNDNAIPTSDFLEAAESLTSLFDVLGSVAFTPVKNDMLGNIKKVRDRQLTAPMESETLQSLVVNELKTKKHTAAEGLLWLVRGLDFTAQALRHNISNANDELSVSFRAAYTNTLKPHHSFMVKPIFSAAMSATPYKKDFYAKLAEDPMKGQEQLNTWLHALERQVTVLKTFQARKEAKCLFPLPLRLIQKISRVLLTLFKSKGDFSGTNLYARYPCLSEYEIQCQDERGFMISTAVFLPSTSIAGPRLESHSEMAEDLSDVYRQHMRHHGCGMAMYQPIAHKDIEPPCCGYFDQNDKWNLIARLRPKRDKDSTALGLTPLSRQPSQMQSIGLRWQPKCSKGVRMFNVDISGKTPALGIPVGADAHVKYQSKKSFGAVLIARNPVEVTAYNDESLFKEWIESNKAQLYQVYGHQLKKYGLWIVTITYTAPGCSINAWMDKDKDAVLSAKAKAAMVGDLGAELDWTDKITDKDWCHYSAKPNSTTNFMAPATLDSKAHVRRSTPRGSRSKSRSPHPATATEMSPSLKHTTPRQNLNRTSTQSPDDHPTRSLTRKQAISPVGNHFRISNLDSEINYDLEPKSSTVQGNNLSPVSSNTEKVDYPASTPVTPVKSIHQSVSPEPRASEGVVMFYDGLYAEPLEWWVEGAKSAASLVFGLRKPSHERAPGVLRKGPAPAEVISDSQMVPNIDEKDSSNGRARSEQLQSDEDYIDKEYQPARDDGVHPSNSSEQFAPSDETRPTGSFGVGKYGEIEATHFAKDRRKLQTTTMEEEEEARPPYLHSMLAGGIGGTIGDILMHSIDTVKTRQQGDPHIPPKYTSLYSTYSKIFRQEGIRRGLYSGVTPAFLGSFPGTLIFFGVYECSKRHMIDAGVNPSLAYLAGGFIADLSASVVYVPSEVLKTRLQLQGRHNNPFFKSGYNYRSTLDAIRTIVRQEGVSALFHGYEATIWRDLPFSALQFAIYEQERKLAMRWAGSTDIGLSLEIATGATAGGMAGVITCPLDVVKTRIQTQINPLGAPPVLSSTTTASPQQQHAQKVPRASGASVAETMHASQQRRSISTSSPSTTVPKSGSVKLDTSSMITGLKTIYKAEGIAGCFRGVGPRFVWTSVQSSTMLVLYQMLLKQMKTYELFVGEGEYTA